MTFSEFQEKAHSLAAYCAKVDGHDLQYVALGLSGEAGEFTEIVKKLWRAGITAPT